MALPSFIKCSPRKWGKKIFIMKMTATLKIIKSLDILNIGRKPFKRGNEKYKKIYIYKILYYLFIKFYIYIWKIYILFENTIWKNLYDTNTL